MMDCVKRKIEQFYMLEKGDRVLIGLSGGADSICLAQVLTELREEYELTLGAVCCHHGLRGEEADKDVDFVEAFCVDRGIFFYTVKEDVEKRALKDKMSLEEAGRAFRYETFEEIMKRDGYQKLAVAHHGDDRAETMLFHLARGTGIAGLSTMEPIRSFGDKGWLIRPLLWTKKREIKDWLLAKGLAWREDESNQSDLYSRNKVRHHILPAMEDINDRAVEHMGETADRLSELYSYIKEEVNRLYPLCVTEEDGEVVLCVSKIKELHSYMQKEIFYKSIGSLAGGRKDITSAHVEMLKTLLLGGSGKEAVLLKGICARRVYDRLILLEKGERREEKKSGIFRDPMSEEYDILMEKTAYTGQKILKNECTKQFDYDKIKGELCIRYWQPGDYLYLREDGGKKKVNRYFIDAKIPPEEREKIPLLADGSHILWIVGHRISAYYKVTEGTKEVLTVTIKNKG